MHGNMSLKMYIGYSCPILIKLEFSRQIFEKYSSTKLYENPTGGNDVFLGGETDRQEKKKLVVSFPNFANAPKNDPEMKWSGLQAFRLRPSIASFKN